MRLRNTSRYPTAEVRQLVEFGMKGVNTARCAVHVKNTTMGYAGMAYHGVPLISPRHEQTTVDRLVTLRIGPEATFPYDNMVTERRWQKVSKEEYDALPDEERRRLRHGHYSDGSFQAMRRVEVRHPYGGSRAPLIVAADWREGLVSVAAHEGRHVWQSQHHKPASEVDAERFAASALERYRAHR